MKYAGKKKYQWPNLLFAVDEPVILLRIQYVSTEKVTGVFYKQYHEKQKQTQFIYMQKFIFCIL